MDRLRKQNIKEEAEVTSILEDIEEWNVQAKKRQETLSIIILLLEVIEDLKDNR